MWWRRCTRTRPWPRACARRRSSRAARGSTSRHAARCRFSGTGRVRTRARVAGGAGRTAAGRRARRPPPPRAPARLHPGPGSRPALSRRGGRERGAGLPRAPRWPGHLPRARAAGGLRDRRPACLPARRALVPRHARGRPHRRARRARARRGGAPVSTAVARRHPPWLKVRAPGGPGFAETMATVRELGLHTVCQEARCPNIGECWGHRTATFMLLGDTCTRNCGFCAVTHGRPLAVDPAEPLRVASAAARLALRHAVVTSVNLDDLADGGAAHLAATAGAPKRPLPRGPGAGLGPGFP